MTKPFQPAELDSIINEMDVCNFISPLTLEAQMFQNQMTKLRESQFPLDSNLSIVLMEIMKSIQWYLGRCGTVVQDTALTKLIEPAVVSNLKHTYHCQPCKRNLGSSTMQAVKHLVEYHTEGAFVADDKENVRPRQRLDSDDDDNAGRPLSKKKLRRQANKDRRQKEIMKIPKKLSSLLRGDLSSFFLDNIPIAEKLKAIPQYERIESDLLKTLVPLFPNVSIRLYKFGSRVTGIATRNSDLDIFVDIGNISHVFENGPSDMTLDKLKVALKGLRNDKKTWTSVVAIKHARVPILKVRNVATNIEIDIGFSNSLGYFNSKLMEYFFNLQPLARRMCVYLKRWMGFTKLNEYFPTYSITLMVIFFLQLRKHLPNMSQLQTDLANASHVGPWIASFEEKNIAELNIKKLDVSTEQCRLFLREFFEFYAAFDYGQHIVCPLYGRLVEIVNFNSEMPSRYTNYLETNADDMYCELDLEKPIIVQDPLQLNHNITKRVVKLHLNAIVHFFKFSAETLK